MPTWMVRLTAAIDDEMEVEAETEEEAIANAQKDWSFTEASDWEVASVEEVED